MSSQLVDKKGGVWQERTVIVKKESNGFGFTLSREMPVFVNQVFPGTSAHRAGILEGDRIIKVNRTEVVGAKHQEVVEMIRDSSHVTLTIIGKMNGTKTTQSPKVIDNSQGIEISAPRHLRELTQQSLKSMLQKQRRAYESLSVEYSKEPAEKVEKELRDCENIIKILEEELAAKAPAIDHHLQTTSSNIKMLTGKARNPPQTEQLSKKLKELAGYSHDDTDVHDGPVSSTKSIPSMDNPSPKPIRSHTFSISNGSLSPGKIWRSSVVNSKVIVGDDSDEDLSDEVASSDGGPFSSLQELKGHPAHLAVFLHYLYLTKDPKYLLFYLVSGSYYNNVHSVEMLRQRGMDIFWTFFLHQSPLSLDVEEGAKEKMLSLLENSGSESKLRSVFVEVRESLTETIINDLGNYRHKRVIGLAGMFNDHLLSNNMNKQKHLEVVLSTLVPDLKQLLDEKNANGVLESLKNQAIAASMVTFVLDLLMANKGVVKVPNIVEKIQSFTRQDIFLLKKGTKRKKAVKGHMFQLTAFKTPTICDQCSKLLWGVIYHGYQCSQCAINLHRYCCINELAAECAGQQKVWPGRTGRRTSALLHRKHSLTTLLSTTAEVNQHKLEGVGSSDLNTSNVEEQADSPSKEIMLSTSCESSVENMVALSTAPKRDRSTSEPHTNSLLLSDSELSMVNSQNSIKDKIKRTNSEKLPSKPDSVERNSSIEASTWSSDESQLGKQGQGSAETITEGNSRLMDEDNMKELLDDQIKETSLAWAEVAPLKLLQSMRRPEIQRQEYIRELVYTERTHLYKLKIMRNMYKIPLQRQGILPASDIEQLFPSLEELIHFHSGFCSQLKERVDPLNDGVVNSIADLLLQRFEGSAGERLCHACSVFASNQPKAEKLLKDWKRRNDKLKLFIKNQEVHPLSNRLTLNDLMPIAWNRFTRYKLLIDNIVRSFKKDMDHLDDTEKQECEKTETALTCVKKILSHVNRQVKFSEEQQRLVEIQSKIEYVGMDRTQHPIARLYKTVDLCAKNRVLVYEGSLTWRLQHKKLLELHALLFRDVMILLEKNEDKDKYLYRCHTVDNVSGTKEELSPIIRLQECLLRNAAADKVGRTFLLVNNSNLMKLAQMYEFIAESPVEKKQWEDAIKGAMIEKRPDMVSPEPLSPLGDESRLSFVHTGPREQLNKIDEDMMKLHEAKLRILRAIQGVRIDTTHQTKEEPSSKGIIFDTIEQAGEIMSTVSHIMVPHPTKGIIADTQHRLTQIINKLQMNLSDLLLSTRGQSIDNPSKGQLDLDLTSDLITTTGESTTLEPTTPSSGRGSSASVNSQDNLPPSELKNESEGGREVAGSTEMLNIPSPIPEVDEALRDDLMLSPDFPSPLSGDEDELTSDLHSTISVGSMGSSRERLTLIVAPPDVFSGDESLTPTPGMEAELLENDSQVSTPRVLYEPHFTEAMTAAAEGKVSPLVLAQTKANGSRDELLSPPLKETQTSGSSSSSRTDPQDKNQRSDSPLVRHSSPSSHNVKVFTSSEHSIQPSKTELPEDTIPTFSLSRLSTSNSICSDEGSDPTSPSYEGSDL